MFAAGESFVCRRAGGWPALQRPVFFSSEVLPSGSLAGACPLCPRRETPPGLAVAVLSPRLSPGLFPVTILEVAQLPGYSGGSLQG